MLSRRKDCFISPRRHTIWRWVAVLCTVAFVGIGLLTAQARAQQGDLDQFLKDEMDFSKKEFKNMKAGKIVTKRLDTDIKQEMAIFSIARINVPREFFIRHYEEQGMNIETTEAEAGSRLSQPPNMEEVQTFALTPKDLKELAKCKVGKCKVKMPANAMKRFRQIDKSAPDFQDQGNALARQALVEYVQAYLKGGNAALAEYHDQKNPIRIAEQFHELLKESPYVYTYVPELHAYLEDFPNADLPGAKNVFYWMKENFGGDPKRPIISVNHVVFYQPEGSRMAIVASKQLYATHYYEAAFGLTIMVDDPENSDPGFYLMHINRSMIDVLRRVPGFLAGDLFKGARNLLHKKMTTVKQNMEALYQTK